MYTKKGIIPFLWGLGPTPHYLNRDHVLLLSPLNFVFKIPSEETEDALRVLLIPDPWHMELASCVLRWHDHKNTVLSWPVHGCWCCWLGCDDGSRYLPA